MTRRPRGPGLRHDGRRGRRIDRVDDEDLRTAGQRGGRLLGLPLGRVRDPGIERRLGA